MLTIDEIKDVKFRTGRGASYYKAEDVDAFIDEVVETFEQKNNEKAELVHKMDILATRIEQYRSDEETVRNALLSAQKVADSTLKEANEQAETIVKDAKSKSEQLIKESENKIAKEKNDLIALQKIVTEMRSEIFHKVKHCIDLVDSLPTEDTVKEIKEKLDKEFPTPNADISFESPVEVEETNNIKSVTEAADKSADIDEKVIDTADEDAFDTPATENTTKFGVLKFGNNYDVDE